ncbi:MAG: serine/threonine-protein kinase [Polyangiaceae bacterium]
MSSEQRYRVIERIAAGGMAEVFRAESASLQGFRKDVAIKRVLPHLAQNKQFIEMFIDEARLGARLSHSNCVQVFDIGMGDGTYFIVMEFIDGADLRSLMQWISDMRGPFPIPEAAHIAMRVCEGLAYAHALTDDKGAGLGIVHRDVSPPNVLITKHGEVKVADFGLAKANSNMAAEEEGVIKGKYSYLAPEAIETQQVDPRSDLFAVGAMLWELIAGKKLFQGKTDVETIKLVARAQIPALMQYGQPIDEELMGIIRKSLSKEPAERFQSGEQFADALSRWLVRSGHSVTSFDVAKLVRDFQARRKKLDIGDLLNATLQQHFNIVSVQQENSQPASSDAFLSSFADLANRYSQPNSLGTATATATSGIRDLADLEDDEGGDAGRVTSPPQSDQPKRKGWWPFR